MNQTETIYTCADCGLTFVHPHNRPPKRCPSCRKDRERQQQSEYNRLNREKRKFAKKEQKKKRKKKVDRRKLVIEIPFSKRPDKKIVKTLGKKNSGYYYTLPTWSEFDRHWWDRYNFREAWAEKLQVALLQSKQWFPNLSVDLPYFHFKVRPSLIVYWDNPQDFRDASNLDQLINKNVIDRLVRWHYLIDDSFEYLEPMKITQKVNGRKLILTLEEI